MRCTQCPVASFTKEVNPRLAKRPLKTNGRLGNHKLTSLVKEATVVCFAEMLKRKLQILLNTPDPHKWAKGCLLWVLWKIKSNRKIVTVHCIYIQYNLCNVAQVLRIKHYQLKRIYTEFLLLITQYTREYVKALPGLCKYHSPWEHAAYVHSNTVFYVSGATFVCLIISLHLN